MHVRELSPPAHLKQRYFKLECSPVGPKPWQGKHCITLFDALFYWNLVSKASIPVMLLTLLMFSSVYRTHNPGYKED